MGRVVTSAAQLGTANDGDEAILGGVRLRYVASAGRWVSAPKVSMTQTAGLGMTNAGTEASWKYPAANVELPPPYTGPLRSQGFFINPVRTGGDLYAAGLRLQEHLCARMRPNNITGSSLVPELALSWYPLSVGAPFLSPSPFNHGVHLVGDLDSLAAHFYSSGWQNTPAFDTAPVAGDVLYPELYGYGGATNFWNFTARYRWVTPDSAAAVTRPRSMPPIANVHLWARADDIPLADGAAVAEWPDYGGFGRNFSQATASKRPLLHKNSLNGHAVVSFDGADDMLVSPYSSTIAQPWTMFLVLRQKAGGPTQQVWVGHDQPSGAPLIYRGDATSQVNVWLGGTDVTYARSSAWPSPYFVLTVIANGATTEIYENQTQKATGNAGSSSIGAVALGNTGANLPANIDVAEVILSYKAATSTERTNVVASLMSRYGL